MNWFAGACAVIGCAVVFVLGAVAAWQIAKGDDQ